MPNYKRINSKSVAESVKKHIEEHLQVRLREYELTNIGDFLEIRKKEAMADMIDKKYIDAQDLVKYMIEIELDFEWKHFEQALFIERAGLRPTWGELPTLERYIEVLAYHMKKVYGVHREVNSVRVKSINNVQLINSDDLQK